MKSITRCEPADLEVLLEIINDSALAYKDVIPKDCWHHPYMPLGELEAEIANGVRFYRCHLIDRIVGVMGIQDVKDVTLIRHAYVRPECRRQGIGRSLLEHLKQLTNRPILIGTWKAADWAIQFYTKNGFSVVDNDEKAQLLRTYWTIPDRQLEESVVLVNSRWRKRRRICKKTGIGDDFSPPVV